MLPELTINQLKHYQQYLYNNMKLFQKQHNPLGQLLAGVFESDTSLIRYLSLDEKDEAHFVKKQNNLFIEHRLAKHSKLPLNWYRHHIRSLKEYGSYSLYSQNLSGTSKLNDEVVSSWMGHADQLGFDYFDVYSGLRRDGHRAFANELNNLLADYGFVNVALV